MHIHGIALYSAALYCAVITRNNRNVRRQEVDAENDKVVWETDLSQELKEREEDYLEWYEKQMDIINAKKEVMGHQ